MLIPTMASFAIVILAVILTGNVSAYDKLTIGQLRPDVGAQLIDMVKNFFPNLNPNCTEIPNPQVDFHLYTRENTDVPIHLDPKNPTEVDPRRKILLVIHGWLSNYTMSHIQKLKDEYLKKYNCHLIMADWAKSAEGLYTDAYCDAPYIGEKVSHFLYALQQQKVRLYMVHVIGHSVGAHIAGYMAKHLHGNYKEHVARITGLDPAGQLYKDLPPTERLDANDAELVDVIHTDGLGMGFWLTFGGVDFHPNCANHQPGCPSLTGLNNDTLITDALCSSYRSLEYMSESIASENFVGVSCGRCPRYCHPDIITEVYAIMGENYKPVQPPAHKHLNFMLPTNKSSPYAQGWDPYKLHVDKSIICKNVGKSSNMLLRKVCKIR